MIEVHLVPDGGLVLEGHEFVVEVLAVVVVDFVGVTELVPAAVGVGPFVELNVDVAVSRDVRADKANGHESDRGEAHLDFCSELLDLHLRPKVQKVRPLVLTCFGDRRWCWRDRKYECEMRRGWFC